VPPSAQKSRKSGAFFALDVRPRGPAHRPGHVARTAATCPRTCRPQHPAITPAAAASIVQVLFRCLSKSISYSAKYSGKYRDVPDGFRRRPPGDQTRTSFSRAVPAGMPPGRRERVEAPWPTPHHVTRHRRLPEKTAAVLRSRRIASRRAPSVIPLATPYPAFQKGRHQAPCRANPPAVGARIIACGFSFIAARLRAMLRALRTTPRPTRSLRLSSLSRPRRARQKSNRFESAGSGTPDPTRARHSNMSREHHHAKAD
jgi:hypothetical protein